MDAKEKSSFAAEMGMQGQWKECIFNLLVFRTGKT